MGLFKKFFNKIGHGLSSIGKKIGHGLSKIFKPVYDKVLKPVGQALGRIGKKALSSGEHFVEGGMDFSERFIDKGRKGALNAADAGVNLSGLLKNPMVMIGAGVLGLMVVTKI